MIGYLEGKVSDHEGEGIILLVGGVGYYVQLARSSAEIGDQLKLWITEVIREDKFDLYGFTSKDQKAMFGLLTDVQGVGPKLAQKILAAAEPDALRQHIEHSDLAFFTAISGVGKKTAQKIILDLRGVIVNDSSAEPISDDVTDALESLGYSRADIAAILPHVSGTSPEERVKSALQLIGKRK